MKLVAGLGNPGRKYAATRHNVGFMVVELLASRAGIALKRKGHQGIYGVGRVAGQEVALLLPQTFMNRSGASVGSACKSLGVDPGDLIVVHDEIDLPFGRLKVKFAGGHGGHNGLRHIREVLGTGEYSRVRVGVGRPPGDGDAAAHVLRPFSPEERRRLDAVLENAAAAVETLVGEGLQQAMNAFNTRDTSI